MRRLTLVRHASTPWNVDGRLLGATDVPLSSRGERQAASLSDRLSGERFTEAYTSDKQRAVATVAAILGAHPGVPLRSTPALREVDFGVSEGESRAAASGEAALLEALDRQIRGWLADLDRRSPDGHVLVVSHGGPLRVLLCLLLGIPSDRHWSFQLNCASISAVECAPGLSTLILLNDCCHLGDDR
jgi:broad specificity phosphatase PhoE